MKNDSIRGEVKKRRFRRTTDSRHGYPLATNLLIEKKQTEGVWASDMTYSTPNHPNPLRVNGYGCLSMTGMQ